MLCPNCETEFRGEDCPCGYKPKKGLDLNHGRCEWDTYDGRCKNAGVISPTITEGNWFCSWHYECLTRKLKDSSLSSDHEKWEEREDLYNKKHARKNLSETTWDKDDKNIVKGLIILGSKSESWEHSPEDCKQEAIKLYKLGWRPKDHSMK